MEHQLHRRLVEGPRLEFNHNSDLAATELERLKHLERIRRMELEIIQREKQELELGLCPGTYRMGLSTDTLPPPYRYSALMS